ncbi:hypothetical protein BH24ACT7_BH24ACT7_26150 [soil metagenome]
MAPGSAGHPGPVDVSRHVTSPWRRGRLVPVAEFADRAVAETAWERLQDEEIPAVLESDPGALGGRAVTRVMVETDRAEQAQRVLADLLGG